MEKEELMTYMSMAIPEPKAIFQVWMPFKELIGVTSVRTEADYERARAIMDTLLEEIGEDEDHPLADVVDYLADLVKAYEDEHYPIPESKPYEILRFLMDQHGLKQEDLADCASQGRISEILSGKRAISKEVAKKLARRFHVSADLFI
jgi:HTH-type transcriptional regulator/antitoxin HigA